MPLSSLAGGEGCHGTWIRFPLSTDPIRSGDGVRPWLWWDGQWWWDLGGLVRGVSQWGQRPGAGRGLTEGRGTSPLPPFTSHVAFERQVGALEGKVSVLRGATIHREEGHD